MKLHFFRLRISLIFFLSAVNASFFGMFSLQQPHNDPCYDDRGRAARCVPDFVNAAFGKPVVASSTCGLLEKPSRFCLTTGGDPSEDDCQICDNAQPTLRHPAAYLTDLNNPQNSTCWVSEPSADYPSNVTLTLSLGKKYELTYVSLQFCNQRPDSMALYKSTDYGRTWVPFQFYSSQCQKMYERQANIEITKLNEQEALCTDAHGSGSQASGSRGSRSQGSGSQGSGSQGSNGAKNDRIAFSTLEDRPSAFDFENSPILQDWVTATDVRVVFHRFSVDQNDLYGIDGDGNNVTEQIRERYFYSMSDFAVGGRCKCNGHASRCVYDKLGQLVCDCR